MTSTVISPETPVGYSASFIFYSLVVSTLVLWYAYFKISRRRMYELAEKLPGPPGIPLFGNAFEFIGEAPAIFKHVYSHSNTFTDVCKFWIGSKLVVFLINPKDIEVNLLPITYLKRKIS